LWVVAAAASACGRFQFDTQPPLRDSRSDQHGETDTRICTGAFCCIDNLEPSSGDHHGCVRKVDGTIWCWGDNNVGKVGNGFTSDVGTPTRVIGSIPAAAQIVTGYEHSCMRGVDGTVWCWGDNTFGQLGVSGLGSSPVPVQAGIDHVAFLASGNEHLCAIRDDGSLWCWGSNSSGQLGDGTIQNTSTPLQVMFDGAVEVVGGNDHTCARRADGTVWCWGLNDRGQLGDNSTTNRPAPVQVPMVGATRLTAGKYHTCGRSSDGSVWCWGANDSGQLGDMTATDRHVPTVTAFGAAVAVAAGEAHTCTYREDGTMWCAGINVYGQLGSGMETFVPESTPIQVQLANVMAIAPGDGHTCAQQIDGAVYCWGRNGDSDLGIGSTGPLVATPTMILLGCP
jgi:alpha-tubulin suppressor-like RCC1 family protein